MLIKPLIDRDALMSQRGLFKACVKSNSRAAMLPPYDVNPLTKVWRVLDSNNNLVIFWGVLETCGNGNRACYRLCGRRALFL